MARHSLVSGGASTNNQLRLGLVALVQFGVNSPGERLRIMRNDAHAPNSPPLGMTVCAMTWMFAVINLWPRFATGGPVSCQDNISVRPGRYAGQHSGTTQVLRALSGTRLHARLAILNIAAPTDHHDHAGAKPAATRVRSRTVDSIPPGTVPRQRSRNCRRGFGDGSRIGR